MEQDKEGVFTIYKNKELVAIIKRDPNSSKHLVYMTKEATSDDIAELLKKE